MMEPNSMRLAILIDAENVQPVFADMIFENAAAMGTVCAREIYGAASALTTWVEPVLKYAIHPNLTIKAAKGKNSSDIALVIGAMDLVVGGSIDGVVIASSDSDFSSLSVRLRSAGLQVIGMGTEKANALWRTACSSFVVLEQPSQKQNGQKQAAAVQKQASQKQPVQKQPLPKQAAPQQPGGKDSKPAPANGHRERTAAIEQLIQKRLDVSGGRVQVSNLFPFLNKLSDYRIDRQGAGKKPLNYLTSTFGESFDFEENEGKMWVSVKGWQPPVGAEKPQEALSAAQQPPEEPDEALDEAPEETPEAMEAEVMEAEIAAEMPDEPEEAPAEAELPQADETDEADDEAAMATRMLIDGGMEAAVAERIVEILRTSADKRAAYNAIRKEYGSIEGRNYYNQAKEILENRG